MLTLLVRAPAASMAKVNKPPVLALPALLDVIVTLFLKKFWAIPEFELYVLLPVRLWLTKLTIISKL